jgi:membrane protein implicated in regulation of membrane protease activity
VLGVALVVAELAVPAFFIIWFGLGALLVGLLLLVAPAGGMTLQLALWSRRRWHGGAVVPGVQARRLQDANRPVGWRHHRRDRPDGEGGGAVRAGRVRFQKPVLGSEEWECVVDEAIAAGERVRVVAMEGSFLKVARV